MMTKTISRIQTYKAVKRELIEQVVLVRFLLAHDAQDELPRHGKLRGPLEHTLVLLHIGTKTAVRQEISKSLRRESVFNWIISTHEQVKYIPRITSIYSRGFE